jgi:hypothetical protein
MKWRCFWQAGLVLLFALVVVAAYWWLVAAGGPVASSAPGLSLAQVASFAADSSGKYQPLFAIFGVGHQGDHVRQLQAMLAVDPAIYAGGDPAGYYGSATIAAVKRFQIKHGILSNGSPDSNGFGLAGPVTRAKLNQLYAGGQVSGLPTTELKEQIAALQRQLLVLLQQLLALLQSSAETSGPVEGCLADWSCGQWGACLDGRRSRTCADLNRCGTLAGQPELSRVCSSGGGGGSGGDAGEPEPELPVSRLPARILCGDNICSVGETARSCPADCRGTVGDGVCQARFESHFETPEDCSGPYYVVDQNNPACSDAGGGTLATPFCHLGAAIREPASGASRLNPGDTVYLREGRQSFGFYAPLDRGGTAERYITFRNYPGERPVVDDSQSFSSAWTLEETAANYRLFSAATSLGTSVATYPTRVVVDKSNPFSRLFSLADLRSVATIPATDVPFDAFFVSCAEGKLYLRVAPDQAAPTATNVAFIHDDGLRFKVRAPYVRFIGLTLSGARDGLRLETPPAPAAPLVHHVEIYDSVIESVPMAIGDTSYQDLVADNELMVYGNEFRNIGTNVAIELTAAPDSATSESVRCVATNAGSTTFTLVPNIDTGVVTERTDPGAAAYRYVANRWEHVIYGRATGVTFAANEVDSGGTATAIIASRNSKYFNNLIKGDVVTGGAYTEIFNNVIESEHGYALNVSGSPLRVFHNLIIGRSHAEVVSPVFLNWWGEAATPDLEFKNNLIIDKAATPRYCLMLGRTNDQAKLKLGGNLYANCSGFRLERTDGQRNDFSTKDLAGDLADWRSFLAGSGANFPETASRDATTGEVFRDFARGDYQLNPQGPAVNAGVEVEDLNLDLVGKERDRQLDIGPYEAEAVLSWARLLANLFFFKFGLAGY